MSDVVKLILVSIGIFIASGLASFTVTGGWKSVFGLRRIQREAKIRHAEFVLKIDTMHKERDARMREYDERKGVQR